MVRVHPKARPIRPCVQVARTAARTEHARGQAGNWETGPEAGNQLGRRHDRMVVAALAPAPHVDALADEVGEDRWRGFGAAGQCARLEQKENLQIKTTRSGLIGIKECAASRR